MMNLAELIKTLQDITYLNDIEPLCQNHIELVAFYRNDRGYISHYQAKVAIEQTKAKRDAMKLLGLNMEQLAFIVEVEKFRQSNVVCISDDTTGAEIEFLFTYCN